MLTIISHYGNAHSTTRREHFTPTGTAGTEEMANAGKDMDRTARERGWWERKMVQAFWKAVGQFLKK